MSDVLRCLLRRCDVHASVLVPLLHTGSGDVSSVPGLRATENADEEEEDGEKQITSASHTSGQPAFKTADLLFYFFTGSCFISLPVTRVTFEISSSYIIFINFASFLTT